MVWQMCGWIVIVASLPDGYQEQYNDPYSIPLENIQLPSSFPSACSSNLAGLIKCLKLQRMQHDGGPYADDMSGRGMHAHPPHSHGRRRKIRDRRGGHGSVLNVFELLSSLLPTDKLVDTRHAAAYLGRKRDSRKNGDYVDAIFKKIIDNQEDLLPENVQVPLHRARYPGTARRGVRRRPRIPRYGEEETSDPNRMPGSEMLIPGMEGTATYPSYNGQYMPQQNQYYNEQYAPQQNAAAYGSIGHMPVQYPADTGQTGVSSASANNLSCAGQGNTSCGYAGQSRQTTEIQTSPYVVTQIPPVRAETAMAQNIQRPAAQQPVQMAYPSPSLMYTAPQQQATNAVPCQAPSCSGDESSSESEDISRSGSSRRVEIRCLCRNVNGTLKSCKCKKR